MSDVLQNFTPTTSGLRCLGTYTDSKTGFRASPRAFDTINEVMLRENLNQQLQCHLQHGKPFG